MEDSGTAVNEPWDAGDDQEEKPEGFIRTESCKKQESLAADTTKALLETNDDSNLEFNPEGKTGKDFAANGDVSMTLHPLGSATSVQSTETGGSPVRPPDGGDDICESERPRVPETPSWDGSNAHERPGAVDKDLDLCIEKPTCCGKACGADDFYSLGPEHCPNCRNVRGGLSESSHPNRPRRMSGSSAAQSGSTICAFEARNSLRLSIEPTFIRCTPLTTVMGNCGKHLKHGIQEFGSSRMYELSRQVALIDDFISHSWRDGRWSKFISLCLLYNGTAAFVASLAFCAVCFTVQLTLPVPVSWGSYKKVVAGQEYDIAEGCLAFLGAPFVCLWFLHSWVSIRNKSLRMRVPGVFLDRLCIHQTDEALKCKGILSIGGILKYSQRMVVLWSPEYFFRLWCMFEVAVWCHLDRMDHLVFVPLSKAVLVVVCASGVYLSCVILLLMHTSDSWIEYKVFYALILGALVSVSPFAMHYLRGLMRDLVALRHQLGQVSVSAAECFCCSHNHVHPDTGQEMQCDRVLVMNTVQELFPGASKGESAKKFDSKVRKDFAKRIIQSIGGPDAMPMRWCLLIVAPVIWRSADVISSRDLPAAVMLRLLLTQFTYVLESLIVVRVCFFMCGYLSAHQGLFVLDVLVSCFGAWGCLMLGTGLFLKTYRASMLEALWPLCVNIFISGLLNLAILWSEFPPNMKRRRHTRTSVIVDQQIKNSLTSNEGQNGDHNKSSRRVSRNSNASQGTRYGLTVDTTAHPEGEATGRPYDDPECGDEGGSDGSPKPDKVVTSWNMAKAAEEKAKIAAQPWSRRFSGIFSDPGSPEKQGAEEFTQVLRGSQSCCESTPNSPISAGRKKPVWTIQTPSKGQVEESPPRCASSASLGSADSIGSVVTSWAVAKDRHKRYNSKQKHTKAYKCRHQSA